MKNQNEGHKGLLENPERPIEGPCADLLHARASGEGPLTVMRMRFLKRLPFLRGKKEEEVAEVEKPEVKVEREFPGISEAELRKHMDKHVAIVDGRIVASAATARKTLAAVKREHSGKEIALRYVASEQLLVKCKCLEGD